MRRASGYWYLVPSKHGKCCRTSYVRLAPRVDVVPAYRTCAPPPKALQPLREALEARQIDAVLLTASSTVTNLCHAMGDGYEGLLSGTCLASIGPITSERARELGLDVAVEAQEFTIMGVLAALEKHFA